MHNSNSFSYQNWISEQEEPQLIVRGNYKRHKEIRTKPATAEELKENFGEAAYYENLKFDALTNEDKDAINQAQLKKMGL